MLKMNLVMMMAAMTMLARLSMSAGSCQASRKCCDGKDTDCSVQKGSLASLVMDLSDEPCYCDHGCLEMGDCCPDFKQFCGGKNQPKCKIKENLSSVRTKEHRRANK